MDDEEDSKKEKQGNEWEGGKKRKEEINREKKRFMRFFGGPSSFSAFSNEIKTENVFPSSTLIKTSTEKKNILRGERDGRRSQQPARGRHLSVPRVAHLLGLPQQERGQVFHRVFLPAQAKEKKTRRNGRWGCEELRGK